MVKRLAIGAVVFVAGVVVGLVWEEPETRVEERVVYRDRVVQGEARETVVTRVESPTVRVVTRTVRVPGGATTTEEERTETGGVATSAGETVVRVEYRDRDVERERIVEREALPTWRVSALAGASLREPLLEVPGASWAVLGASVERRVAGPVYVGAWATTAGVGGVSLGVTW